MMSGGLDSSAIAIALKENDFNDIKHTQQTFVIFQTVILMKRHTKKIFQN